MYGATVNIVRYVFGIQMTISGLNWWVKLTRYPSIADFVDRAPPDDILGALIQTGYLFHLVKGVELACGLALIFNLYVPLMLVVAFPVALGVLIVDLSVTPNLRGLALGIGAFAQQAFLMLAYFGYYRPMLAMRAKPDLATASAPPLPQPAMMALCGAALALGLVCVGILAFQIILRFAGPT
jgi:putative oxidoreductase